MNIALVLTLVTIFYVQTSSAQYITDVCKMNDVQLRASIMFESQRAHRFLTNYGCPCPYTQDAFGRACGWRSTYTRTRGQMPVCYQHDITRQDLIDFRKFHCTGQTNKRVDPQSGVIPPN